MTDQLIVKKDMPKKVKGYKKATLDDGRIIEIPVNKTMEELYGPANPSGNFTFTDDILECAKRIASNCKSDTGEPKSRTELIVNYIRKDPVVVTHTDKEGRTARSVGQGCPVACIVGFKYNGDTYLGWSQSNRAGEPVSYSKEKARICAVLRGIVDTVTIDKNFAKTAANKPIPVPVRKHLKNFVERTNRYFKADFVNFTS